ncbi:MAG: sugar ABC transporter permease [Anaerolineae bacterium]|nr:sugar ABC transporter permease [Anaerolineae bacterium]
MSTLLNIFGRTPRARRKAFWGLALIAPNTIGLLVFFGIPVLVAFGLSFFEWNGIRAPEFTGLDNFTRIFRDPLFGRALANTLTLALLVVPLNMALALGAAVLLNQRLPLRNLFRTIYFLPVVTSTVAASVVWIWIFQPRLGLIGIVPGLGTLQWLTRPELVLIPIAAVTIWQRVGFDMILFLAGLQNVPRALHEAAVIDGANSRQRFFNITLPMLSPTTFLILTLNFISVFQIFDQVYIMTQRTTPGGVSGSATTLTFLLYQTGFTRSEFGYASAIALALFVIVLSITVIQLRLQRRWVFYESEAG